MANFGNIWLFLFGVILSIEKAVGNNGCSTCDVCPMDQELIDLAQQQKPLFTRMLKIEQLPIPCLILGEGPHWIEEQKALVFVDVYTKKLRRHFVETGRHQVLNIDDGGQTIGVAFVIPVEGMIDLFMIGLQNSLAVIKWSPFHPDQHTAKATFIHTIHTDFSFNDAKCDPRGRLWAGTLSEFNEQVEPLEFNTSGLYRFDYNLVYSKHFTLTLSNGMTWSLDKKHFFFVDSVRGVYKFDYNDRTGQISNHKLLLDFEKAGLFNQIPDGMTIDVDGNLWIACFGSGQVINVDPNSGEILRSLKMPVTQVASVAWGGDNFDILYVVTATLGLTPQQAQASPKAGATYTVTGLGTKGLPHQKFKGNLRMLNNLKNLNKHCG